MRRIVFAIVLFVSLGVYAEVWKTHFGYADVSQIALSKDVVYGLSEGLLFSVDKTSEKITEWTKQKGLYGGEIGQIAFDDVTNILLVAYATGRMDLIEGSKVTHLSDFYNKDMTSLKRANAITFHKGRAYLSMEFGILSFDMHKHEFVDTYYIGAEAGEVFVEDVVIKGDSIYAFAAKNLYCAALKDNLVDYRVWKSETNTGRIARDTDKGKRYTDSNKDVWTAGGSRGIVRKSVTGEENAYKPVGPMTNIPYSLSCGFDGTLYMLSGGRWALQYHRPGNVMYFRDGKWTFISQSAIQSKTGKPAEDFIDVAVDPRDKDHYYVTSYGTGLYEFRGTKLLNHFTPANSTVTSIIADEPDHYTRCCGSVFDSSGNLLLMDTNPGGPTIPILTSDGQWSGVNIIVDGVQMKMNTPCNMIIDREYPNYKWLVSGRNVGRVILFDDGGTLTDPSDDFFVARKEWMDQNNNTIAPTEIYTILQDRANNKWVGTNKGVIILPADVDFKTSDRCRTLTLTSPDGGILMEEDKVQALCMDNDGNIWCGTTDKGVYVLSADGMSLVHHYSSDNTIMPSSSVMSLACDQTMNRVYIGTGLGLVSYSDHETAIDEPSGESNVSEEPDYGSMHSWSLHPAYSHVSAITASGTDVYALSEGALFSANRTDETITCYSKLTGLSGSNILFVGYNKTVNKLLIVYQNGLIDVMYDSGITALSDLYLKGETTEISINNITMYKQYVYFALSFGIVVLDMKKGEVADTYYIGKDATDVDVKSIAILGDSVYAASSDRLYAGALSDALIDFANWRNTPLPYEDSHVSLAATDDKLYILCRNALYNRKGNTWTKVVNVLMDWIRSSGRHLLGSTSANALVEIDAEGKMTTLTTDYTVLDALYDNGEYWLAADHSGLLRYKQDSYQAFQPEGPLSNYSYKLQFAGDRLMLAQGGGWAVQFYRRGDIVYYDYSAKKWHYISADQTIEEANALFLDVMDYAVDPEDQEHFFATSYGNGVAEFRDGHLVNLYNESNSTLRSAIEDDKSSTYVRTVGATYDRFGNLWVLNTSARAHAMNILAPDGTWHWLNLNLNGTNTRLVTPRGTVLDRNYPNSKWFIDCRNIPGVIVVDDGGTPFNPMDDHMAKHSSFVDQLGTVFTPTNFYCITQDHDGLVWVGTSGGPFYIKSVESFLASNQVTRPIIYRNDGTNLVDYLLHEEQINAICVDGGNRKWIGTATSGVFLMSADGTETIYHFTTDNSPLPSDEILSIAIHPTSGEVFFGTSKGLASFRSDAAEPTEEYSNVYAYPNPVRPNYQGVITITGLMDNTVVNIIDAGGNLVCKTKSNGGIAIWDGKNLQGKRVATGVYTVLCNTADGANHAVTKILVTH